MLHAIGRAISRQKNQSVPASRYTLDTRGLLTIRRSALPLFRSLLRDHEGVYGDGSANRDNL